MRLHWKWVGWCVVVMICDFLCLSEAVVFSKFALGAYHRHIWTWDRVGACAFSTLFYALPFLAGFFMYKAVQSENQMLRIVAALVIPAFVIFIAVTAL